MERKVALVTGAGKGIGAEIVRTLASNGYAVIINYRNSEKPIYLIAPKQNTFTSNV